MRELTPLANEVGLRIDAWLGKRFPAFSHALIRRSLAKGILTLAGRTCAKGDLVEEGVVYRLNWDFGSEVTPLPNAALPLAILWQDNAFVALNKPAGMNCQPLTVEEKDTLANALLARFPEVAGVGDGPLTCGVIHRIDRETSGLVLAARSQVAYLAIRALFAAHAIEKRYLAVVAGEVRKSGRLENLLAHNPRAPGRMVDAEKWRDAKRPMRAVTDYRPLKHLLLDGTPCTLLDVIIRTGVTHQIRAQLSFAGMPIIGDTRYGGPRVEGFDRHFLHAHKIACAHPLTGVPLNLQAPPTEDLRRLIARCKVI